MIKVGVSQRGMLDDSHGVFVLRNFTESIDRDSAQFSVTAVDATGNPIANIPSVTKLQRGSTFELPAGRLLKVIVRETSGENQGESMTLDLQPYVTVAREYDISHFYHEENTEVVWAIGSPVEEPDTVCVLRSDNYFDTCEEPRWSIKLKDGDVNHGKYRSIYMDQFENLIIGWSPGPMISRDGGRTFDHLFSWLDPDNGLLCPFWNITEDDNGLMVISEYGGSKAVTKPHGSHRGTFWSRDQERKTWRTVVVDAGRDRNDVNKFGGYFRHIHGYHINPDLPHVHHMFLGDPATIGNPEVPQPSDGTPGYYISQDGGDTWSTEIIRQWPDGKGQFYNGPCFVTWWPNGRAFIVNDTGAKGYAYYWGSGPVDWGGPGFDLAIELSRDVDEDYQQGETPWMAMAVKGHYETYCTSLGSRSILWRYDADIKHIQVLAEASANSAGFVPLHWLSGSRHNRIPSQARYFFTSGNRRFPRI